MINKTKQVFFLILIFLGFSITILLFTHDQPSSKISVLLNQQAYITDIQPWLQEVAENYSLATIQQTKENLMNFKSNDRLVGQVHITLFLAFDAWEKFLLTNQASFKKQTLASLLKVEESVPDLSTDLQSLKNLLN